MVNVHRSTQLLLFVAKLEIGSTVQGCRSFVLDRYEEFVKNRRKINVRLTTTATVVGEKGKRRKTLGALKYRFLFALGKHVLEDQGMSGHISIKLSKLE